MAALPQGATVGVIGAGTMGAGIAQVAAAAGHTVLLHDAAEGAVSKGIAGIGAGLDRLVERGKMDRAGRDALVARIRPAASLAEFAPAALVIEAVVEKLEVKRALFSALEKIVAPGAILASNTSSLSITEIGAALQRPGRCVGMHFFNPAPVMALVEIVSGLATDPAMAATTFETAGAWGKSPVHAKSTPGFIANRIARPFYGEALRLLEEGVADVPTLDAALRDCGGFRMGPFELLDLIGIDVNFLVTQSVWQAYFGDPRYTPSVLQQEMVAAGRHGRKTGRGWYDYSAGAAKPAPGVLPPGPKPRRIRLSQNPALAAKHGVFDPAAALAAMAAKAGIELAYEDVYRDLDGLEAPGGIQLAAASDAPPPGLSESGEGFYEPYAETAIRLDGCILRFTRGETGHDPGWRGPAVDDGTPVILYDLALDYAATPRVIIAAPPDAPKPALLAAAGFFQALGKTVTAVNDTPGLVVMRLVALLANEAADAVHRGVCSAEAADTATVKGLNYPLGPLAWAARLGWHRVHDVLRGLGNYYGEPRYRISPYVRKRDWEAQKRHER
jgi:3-hydroxybutyryl-CoA dehydrogenase